MRFGVAPYSLKAWGSADRQGGDDSCQDSGIYNGGDQPNKLWQGRYPKGMYRAAAGSALAGLLAPIVMQESQDGR